MVWWHWTNGRIANYHTDKSDRDMLDVLIARQGSGTPSADEVSACSCCSPAIHTSRVSADRVDAPSRDAYAAIDETRRKLYGDGRSVVSMLQIPQLESSAERDTLRLHPPLIILMRVAREFGAKAAVHE